MIIPIESGRFCSYRKLRKQLFNVDFGLRQVIVTPWVVAVTTFILPSGGGGGGGGVSEDHVDQMVNDLFEQHYQAGDAL
jgi:hypothetical protein